MEELDSLRHQRDDLANRYARLCQKARALQKGHEEEKESLVKGSWNGVEDLVSKVLHQHYEMTNILKEANRVLDQWAELAEDDE